MGEGSDSLVSSLLVLGLLLFVANRMTETQVHWRRSCMRIASIAFIGVIVYALASPPDVGSIAWPLACIRGLIVAAVAWGVAGIVFPGGAWLYDSLVVRPAAAVLRQQEVFIRARQEKRERQEEEKRLAREHEQWLRDAPLREKQRREADLCAARMQEEQTKRHEARSQCEQLFNLYERDIRKRFSRAQMREYMQQFMSDKESAEAVERRAKELRDIIEQHYQQMGGDSRSLSIDQLAEWFIAQKSRIENAPMDARQKQTVLAQLNRRYAELSQTVLDKMSP